MSTILRTKFSSNTTKRVNSHKIGNLRHSYVKNRPKTSKIKLKGTREQTKAIRRPLKHATKVNKLRLGTHVLAPRFQR